jgi:hypothetical protein
MPFTHLWASYPPLRADSSTVLTLWLPACVAESSKVQDAAPGVAAEENRALVAAELGWPVEAAFGSVDAEPLAAASLDLAHAATLLDGAEGRSRYAGRALWSVWKWTWRSSIT